MKAFSINSKTREVTEIDMDIQANTIYTFFSSISIYELVTLQEHTIYTDADAISKDMPAYFIGEQLIIGDALILGKDTIFDIDAKITQSELESLLNYEVDEFYKTTLALLQNSEINLYKSFSVNKEDEDIELNIEWVLHVYSIADAKTKSYFLDELKKSIDAKKDITHYFKNMAILALNAMG